MRNLPLCFILLCTQGVVAREINVANHGVVPGKDVTYSLNRLIESVKGEAGVTLIFPKGRYEFYPENAVEMYRAVSNHDNGLKRMAFPLFQCKDMTIDGGGSLFLFHGRMVPFTLENVQGVTLQNFVIDWHRSFHDEMTVVERQDDSFTVEIDSGRYPFTIEHGNPLSEKYDWRDPLGSNIVFDPNTRSPLYSTSDYSFNFTRPHQATVQPAPVPGKNRVKIMASVRKTLPPVGSVLVTCGVHPTSRLCPWFEYRRQ